MKIDDIEVTRTIVESYMRKFLDSLELDVAVIGAGPAGMVCAYYLGTAGAKVAVFEKKLSPGGGMWGGGMTFNEIVVGPEAKEILDELGITTAECETGFTADSVEATGAIIAAAARKARIFNLLLCEDVAVEGDRVTGIVLNNSAVLAAGLHVDPLTIRSKFVVEATGHDCCVAHILCDRHGYRLLTETGKVMGEGAMWARRGEEMVVSNTKEVYPGVWATGMAANAVFGAPRMGPIFGGMLLSGRKCAQDIREHLD
jgi:thiamine thiazole synthase